MHIRKWTEKYITVEEDEMTDNYVNATRRDFFSVCCTLTDLLNLQPVLAGIYCIGLHRCANLVIYLDNKWHVMFPPKNK